MIKSTVILPFPCIASLFTNSFNTNKWTVILFCTSAIIGSYTLSRNMWKLIMSETNNRRNVKIVVTERNSKYSYVPSYLNANSSTRKLRTRHIAVTGNHLPFSYQNVFRMMLFRSLYWRPRALLHSKRVMNEKRSGISKKCHLINFFRNLYKKLNGFSFSYSKVILHTCEIYQHQYFYWIMKSSYMVLYL